MPAVALLREYADGLPDEQRREIYDDTEVRTGEWDQYLRAGGGSAHLAGFLSSLALGTTQLINADGVALLTVHSSKGLEFEVVFVAGMAEGIFPDYRAQGKTKETAEERRNAFVAVTRSKRLIIFLLSADWYPGCHGETLGETIPRRTSKLFRNFFGGDWKPGGRTANSRI